MMTIQEKENAFIFAEKIKKIRKIDITDQIHNQIRRNLNYRYLGYFVISIIVSIISCLVLFVALNSKIAIINVIVFFFVFSPIVVLVEYIKKLKRINMKQYKCYVGKIERISDDGNGYRICGLDIDENITFLKKCKPSKEVQINDDVIVYNILDDIYLLDYSLL